MQTKEFLQKRFVNMLEKMGGLHTSLVTILCPGSAQISRIAGLLTKEMATASNIKSRVNRQSVLDALKTIQVFKI
jgi:peptide chain release factor subunit 1